MWWLKIRIYASLSPGQKSSKHLISTELTVRLQDEADYVTKEQKHENDFCNH
jgi:hypothetical protein